MITLVGGGGIPNYGDELIINNWLKWYSDTDVPTPPKIVVEGHRSSVLRNVFADKFPDVEWSHAIRMARQNFRKTNFWGALEGGLNAAHSSVGTVRRTFVGACEASLIHVHGGGYINGKWPSHAFVLGLASAAHATTGTRVVATGLGLRPLSDPDREQRRLLDQAVDSFEFIEVRDSWSYEFLTRNLSGRRPDKVMFGLDDAFLYPVGATDSGHRTLHLALRDDPAGSSIIKRLTAKFVGSFDRHRFWVCNPSDAGAYAKLSKRFRLFELAGTSQLVEEPNLGHEDVLITERFHPHLQAARAGSTGVFWSGSGYYDTKHGSLVDLGSPFVPDDGREFREIASAGHQSKMAANDAANVDRKRELARRALEFR